MKNKCCLIIPYFGHFPNYFNIFLKTCGANPDFTWMIFTDDKNAYKYPANVIVNYITFPEFCELASKRMGFEVAIDDFHKICDYKPSYGYIFEEYITNYDFWGYCDVDLIFGNLSQFITDYLLENYDKIFCLGHLSLYRNTKDINRLFKKDLNGESLYKKVFSDNSTWVFDEPFGRGVNHSIYEIFLNQNKKVYDTDLAFNCKIAPANFVKTTFNPKSKTFSDKSYMDSLFIWDNGQLENIRKSHGKLVYEYFPYMHFQARKMAYDTDILDKNYFKILGNGFYKVQNYPVDIGGYVKEKKIIVSLRYMKIMFKWKFNGLKKRLGLVR